MKIKCHTFKLVEFFVIFVVAVLLLNLLIGIVVLVFSIKQEGGNNGH